MFDTNIFDAIIDEKINVTRFLNKYEIFVTHIQRDEIEAMDKQEKQERKKKLLNYFKELNQENIPTESFVLGTSKLGSAKLTPEDNLIEELRKENLRHTEDALIGEAAIKNNLILVTNDPAFLKKVNAIGGKAVTFKQFIHGEFDILW